MVIMQSYTTINPSIFSGLQNVSGYEEILLIGSVTFLMFSAIRYMGAKIFGDEQSITKAKAEILDNIAVAFLFAGLWLLLQLIEFIAALAYPVYFGNQGPVGMFDNYIIPTIKQTRDTARALASQYASQAALKLSTAKNDVSIFSYPLLKGNEYSRIKDVNFYVLNAELNMSIAIGLSVALKAIQYIKDAAGYFFIYGLLMRIFPPLRAAGSLLLALAIGFYYIYPLTTAMFLFGIPTIKVDQSKITSIDQAFCSLRATGAVILPEQELSKGFDVTLGNPQTVEEDFGLVISTNFLLSQLVALSLTSMFVSNFSLILSRGIYSSAGIQTVLGRLL